MRRTQLMLLEGEGDVWRLRVGDFRVYYGAGEDNTVRVADVSHKGRKTTEETR